MSVRAGDIMTADLTVFAPDDRVNSVLDEMDDHSFDVAPIKISNYIRKYVRRQDLVEPSDTDKIIDHAQPLEESDFVGTDIPVIRASPDSRDLLNLLHDREQRFVFVVGDGIEGIITHADLNKIQAGQSFYTHRQRY